MRRIRYFFVNYAPVITVITFIGIILWCISIKENRRKMRAALKESKNCLYTIEVTFDNGDKQSSTFRAYQPPYLGSKGSVWSSTHEKYIFAGVRQLKITNKKCE